MKKYGDTTKFYINSGDVFNGYQKSLSKKSEYFFSELEVNITDINHKEGLVWGTIDKKIVSISGKKEHIKAYFEGEIIDGYNHSFTSNLTANCEVLDVYFWNRFPTFKDINSLADLQKQSPNFIYMRWHERGMMKQ
jgi:hypothetical protein